MPEHLRFAVITPVYNTAKYLPECLDSLLAQTYKNFVAFLIDDGSTDGSAQIIDQYAAQDARLKVVHKKNGGVSSARNTALDLIEKDSKFDFVIFLDSDDIWEPFCLEIVKKHIEEGHADMVSYGVHDLNKSGIVPFKDKLFHAPRKYNRDEAYLFCFDNTDKKYTQSPAFSFFIGNIAFKAQAIKGLRFNTSLKIGEDQNFKFQAIARINGFMAISDVLMNYRLRKGSLSHSEKFTPSDLRLFLLWMKDAKTDSPSARRIIELRVADIWWSAIREAASKGMLKDFWKEAEDSLQFMKENCVTGVLNRGKYKKRIFMFSLGKTFLRLYFALRIKKPKSIKMEDYFD